MEPKLDTLSSVHSDCIHRNKLMDTMAISINNVSLHVNERFSACLIQTSNDKTNGKRLCTSMLTS